MLEKSVSALRVIEKLQIKDVKPLSDMDNFVGSSLKFPLLKHEVFVHSFCP